MHACRLDRTWYSRRCGSDSCDTEERSDSSYVEFRADGALARRVHRNPDGSEWTSTCEYDASGRLAAIRAENGTEPAGIQLFEYDDAGRLARMIVSSKDGARRVAESYEYHAGGAKKTSYVDLAGLPPNTHIGWAVEGSDSSYSARGAATVTTLYNARECPTEMLFHDREGRTLSRVEFRRDAAGNLVEEAQTRMVDILPADLTASLGPAELEAMRAALGTLSEPVRQIHRYDEQGRRVESRTDIGRLGSTVRTMAYNERGDRIVEISEDLHREFRLERGRAPETPVSESASRSEARLLYEYDSRGNWTKRTIEGRGGTNEGFSVSSLERRTISYFD